MIVRRRDTDDSNTASGARKARRVGGSFIETWKAGSACKISRETNYGRTKARDFEFTRGQLTPSLANRDWTRLALLEGLLSQPRCSFEKCAMQCKGRVI